MAIKREMFLMCQAVVDKIVVRYGYEMLGEFTFLLSQYCAYWDNYGSGEGFDFSHYSEAVLIYFDMIRPEVDEKHRQFIAQGEKMAKIAKERWEKEKRDDRRREQKRQWYAVNRKKRQEIPDDVPLKEDDDRRCVTSQSRYVDNSEKVNQKRRQKASSDVSSVSKNVSSGVSSDVPQSEADKGAAQNDAYRIQNYGIMEHKNHKENYGIGGGEFVDNFAPPDDEHNPSSGLTGHNLAIGSVIKRNHKNGEHKNHKKRKNHKNGEHKTIRTLNPGNLEQRNRNDVHNPPQPCGQLPRGEPKLGKDVVQPAALRKTIYGDTWIKIGDDFEIDLFDPMFADVDRARKYLINGFQNFARREWSGMKKDKWWLRDQLTRNFANRQGDVSYMSGRESGGNAYVSGAKR